MPQVQRAGEHMSVAELFADHIRTADAYRLSLSAWLPAGQPRAVVLALHGFNDYRRSFEETGAYLAQRGIAVYAYDMRGFGETAHAGKWFGDAQLAADAQLVVGLLRQRHPGVPLHLLGESMGGAVALVALSDRPPGWVDGLVLLAPAVWARETMPLLQRAALWLAAHTFPAMQLSGRGLNIRATDNDAALAKLRQDPLVIKDTRVDALWGLTDLMDRALATPPPAWLPTLILYGARDQIIPKAPTCRWLARLPDAATMHVALYPEGWHMLTRDLQAGTVLADIAAWLLDPAGRLPSGRETDRRRPDLCAPVQPA